MNNNLLRTYLPALLLMLLSLQSFAKEPPRLFASLANTPNITLVYISEAALKSGIRVPDNSAVALSLAGSTLTSFEMVKAQFDGKEKRAIVRLGKEIVQNNDLTLLTEVQDGFDSGFTRIYYSPDGSNTTIAKQVFIFQSSNSFGATLISLTGRLDISKLFKRQTVSGPKISLTDILSPFML